MASVKGSKITSKLSYLAERHGESSPARVLAALDEEDRKTLQFVMEVGWYPQDLYERLLKAICRTVGEGDDGILAQIGAFSADHQFSRVYRVYRSADLVETLQNMVPIHAKLNQPSGMKVSIEGPGQSTIVVTDPPATPVICAVSSGFYRRVLELHGAREVDVREPACSGRGDAACQFELRWTPA
jgi:hypothetical protein